MKHQVKGRKFSRTRKQRKALIRSILTSLILHGKIKTTEAKAKEIKPLFEKIVSQTKKNLTKKDNNLNVIRELKKKISPAATEKMIKEIIPQAKGVGGYARIVKLHRRKSDGARMAIIEIL